MDAVIEVLLGLHGARNLGRRRKLNRMDRRAEGRDIPPSTFQIQGELTREVCQSGVIAHRRRLDAFYAINYTARSAQ